jgi:hypothetical protein
MKSIGKVVLGMGDDAKIIVKSSVSMKDTEDRGRHTKTLYCHSGLFCPEAGRFGCIHTSADRENDR